MNWTLETEKKARKHDNKLNKDSYQTPDFVYDWANDIFGFDIDLAASDENHKHEKYFTRQDNALDKEWSKFGHIGWCNPPYSNVVPWIEKAIEEAKNGFRTVMLLPTPNGDSYNDKMLKQGMIFIIGRLAFLDWKTGVPVSGNNRGSCLVLFGFDSNIGFVHRDTMKEMHEGKNETNN